MIEEVAQDYSNYFKVDLSKELQPINHTVDEMLTRLEEFETLMKVVETSNEGCSSKAYQKVIECKGEIDILKSRIDFLQLFLIRVNDDLALMEKKVENAETNLGIPDNKLKSFIKPFLNKISKEPPQERSVDLSYSPQITFKTKDYFPSS